MFNASKPPEKKGVYHHRLPKVGYSQLAQLAHNEGKKLFKLRPKCHMWHEIFEAIDVTQPFSLSPIATCCWTDEDYIGRVARIARAGHGSTVSITCMRKCLGLYQSQFLKTLKCKRGAKRKIVLAVKEEDVFGALVGEWDWLGGTNVGFLGKTLKTPKTT